MFTSVFDLYVMSMISVTQIRPHPICIPVLPHPNFFILLQQPKIVTGPHLALFKASWIHTCSAELRHFHAHLNIKIHKPINSMNMKH